jgi:serine/threonine-protein kinase HipA
LLGARDDTRQGAIQFRQPQTSAYYSRHHHAVPRLIDVARLMRAADRLRPDSGFDRDLADLIDAGSSLGGARPKAAVISSSGRLTIAKFPRLGSDEWDTPSWEETQLRLARQAGIPAGTVTRQLPISFDHPDSPSYQF